MFKRLLIILLIFSPLFYTFVIGYPLGNKSYSVKNINYSRRCFKVGELKQFAECYKNNKTLSGVNFFSDLNKKLLSLYPNFNYLFLAIFIINLLVTATLL